MNYELKPWDEGYVELYEYAVQSRLRGWFGLEETEWIAVDKGYFESERDAEIEYARLKNGTFTVNGRVNFNELGITRKIAALKDFGRQEYRIVRRLKADWEEV